MNETFDADKITKEQLVEVETLRSIYAEQNEYEELIPGRAFILNRTSPSKRASVALRVTLSENYPFELPDVQVKGLRGLTPTNCVMLQSLLESTAQEHVGTAMMMAIIAAADDWLRKNVATEGNRNATPTTSYSSTTTTTTTTTTTSTTSDASYQMLGASTTLSYEDYKDYDCLSPKQIISVVEEDLTYVSDLLKIPQTTARILLTHYAWNKKSCYGLFGFS